MNRNVTSEYWLKIVEQVAEASTCRVKIGCIIVKNNYIQGVGYLGSLHGERHCNVTECLFVEAPHMGSDSGTKSCIRTVHAEMNAVLNCREHGDVRNNPLTCWSTYSPCINCFKLLRQIGVNRFYFRKHYRDEWRDKLIEEIRFKEEVEGHFDIMEFHCFPKEDDVSGSC